MIIGDYIDPVELDKPDYPYLPEGQAFVNSLSINTQNNPIDVVKGFDLAIIGIGQNENESLLIRSYLYSLSKNSTKIKIVDLGNLKKCNTSGDLHFAILDITTYLLEKKVIPVFFGGTSMEALSIAKAFDNLSWRFNFLNVTPSLSKSDVIEPLNKLGNLQMFYHLAGQSCMTSTEILDFIETNHFESLRLGKIRGNIIDAEPYLRDADIFLFGLSSVRRCEAPAVSIVSPNGLFAEDACQLAWYAGMGGKTKAVLLSDYVPEIDIDGATAALAAQILWYFIEGFANRKLEFPEEDDPQSFKKFIISQKSMDNDVVFYKSIKTNRWWVEIPVSMGNTIESVLAPSSQADYNIFVNNEIPDRWSKLFRRWNRI